MLQITTPIATPKMQEDGMINEKVSSLKNILQLDLLACDAKWTLFVAAAQSYRFETELFPVPPQFICNESSNQVNINALITAINDTPRLNVVLQLLNDFKPEELNLTVIDLLFWVLVVMADPYLSPIPMEKITSLFKALNISVPEINYMPTQALEVVSLQQANSKLKLDPSENLYGISYAFYGNQLDIFYSLLQNGFKKFHNSVTKDSNQDDGTIVLNSDLRQCISKSPSGAAWGSSACGSIISCVALCEYYDDPESVTHKTTESLTYQTDAEEIHVKNANYIRLRYLLFYGNRTSDIDASIIGLPKGNWMKRNGKYVSVLLSLAVVITALTATHRSGAIRDVCLKHVHRAIVLCRNVFRLNFFEFK